jgi:hypothetical protein
MCPWITEAGYGISPRNASRYSTYRLGGPLPLLFKLRLDISGYFAQKITVRDFIRQRRAMGYHRLRHCRRGQAGIQQPDRWHSDVGAGVGYKAAQGVCQVILAYAYGCNAMRRDGWDARSLVLLFQFDLEARQYAAYPSLNHARDLGRSHGLERIFGTSGAGELCLQLW